MAFLNKEGLERLWQHIVIKLGDKADNTVVGSLQDLTTDNKENLVAAINEAATSAKINGTEFNNAFQFKLTYDDGTVKEIKVLGVEV